jgi:hypothetical protein
MTNTKFHDNKEWRLVLGLWPTLLSFVSCALAFLVLQPGMMSFDSLLIWRMSHSLLLTDAHPPIYALSLRVIRLFWDSPAAVVATNLTAFGIGATLLAEVARGRSLLIVSLPPLFVFLPFILNFVGVLWKDTALAVCWWAAVGVSAYLLINQKASRAAKSFMLIGAFMFFTIGLLSRYNSITAAPFVLSALFLPLVGQLSAKKLRRTFISSCAISAIVYWGLSSIINKEFHVQHVPFFSTAIVLYDLAGITEMTGSNAFPVEFDDSHLQAIKDCYQANVFDPCQFVSESIEGAHLLGTARLITWWLSKIRQHPLAYAHHRIRVFGSFLRFAYPDSYYVIHTGIDKNDLGLSHPDSRLFGAFKSYIFYVKDAFFMRPWFWLVVNIFAFSVSVAHWREPLPSFGLLVSLSGTVYILSYLPFGVDSDFRYAYWGVLSALAASFVFAFGARKYWWDWGTEEG